MDELLPDINAALASDETVILFTVLEGALPIGSKRLLRSDGRALGTLGNARLDAAADAEGRFRAEQRRGDTFALWPEKFAAPENSYTGELPRARILIEIVRPQPCLLICGAGHIARALSQLGLILGFRAIVIDDRAEFASRTFFPDARVELIAAPFPEAISSIKVSASMAVVIVTRGHRHDEDCLRLLLSSSAHYLGMIGSRRRVAVVMERLGGEGFSAEQLARIHAPIGLDIGARTPEEIALAILAEIILVRNRGPQTQDCRPLRAKNRA